MKKAADTIFDCLEEKKMSQRQLAVCMGEDVRNLNQQLNRRNDMKVERFIDVLDYIGFRVEIVENDGIRKVSLDFAKSIRENKTPKGCFWSQEGEKYTAICCVEDSIMEAMFESKEECFEWLRVVKK